MNLCDIIQIESGVKMITINDKQYNIDSKKISFGKYSVTQDGKKRNGKAPFITFKFENMFLGLETIYDTKGLKELNLDDKKDISKYTYIKIIHKKTSEFYFYSIFLKP